MCVWGASEKTVKGGREGGRMEGERKRQPTLLLPQGFSGLLMFTSRISIKMGEECLCVVTDKRRRAESIWVHAFNWSYALSSKNVVCVT